jgi:hypothetical protein
MSGLTRRAVCCAGTVLLALPGSPTFAGAQRITDEGVAAFVRAMTPVATEWQRIWGMRRDVMRDIAVQRIDSLRLCRGDERSVIKPGTAAGVPLDEYERLLVAATRGDTAARRRVTEIGREMQAASRTLGDRGKACERSVPPQEWFVRRREVSAAELKRLGWSSESRATMRSTGRSVDFGARLDSIAGASGATLDELRALHDRLRPALRGDASALDADERAVLERHHAALQRLFQALAR